MYGTSTSKNFRTPGPQPHVMVGPIIGKVTTTTARILVEIDAKGSLTLVIEENHARFEKQQSFLQRQLSPGRRELNQPVNPGRLHIKKLQKDVEANRPSVFEFRDLKPGTRYNVEVKGCRGSTNGSFCTFPVEPAETLTVGVISCNKIFITDLLIAPHSDLWTHLSKLVEAGKVDFLVHLGDQVLRLSSSECAHLFKPYAVQNSLFFRMFCVLVSLDRFSPLSSSYLMFLPSLLSVLLSYMGLLALLGTSFS